MKLKRIGMFSIPLRMIEEQTENVLKIMSKVVILKAELCYYTDAIDYIAYSKEFDSLKEGSMPLLYQVKIDSEKNISFVK